MCPGGSKGTASGPLSRADGQQESTCLSLYWTQNSGGHSVCIFSDSTCADADLRPAQRKPSLFSNAVKWQRTTQDLLTPNSSSFSISFSYICVLRLPIYSTKAISYNTHIHMPCTFLIKFMFKKHQCITKKYFSFSNVYA